MGRPGPVDDPIICCYSVELLTVLWQRNAGITMLFSCQLFNG